MRAEKEEEQKKKEEELLKGPSLYNSNTKIYYEPIWFDASYFAKYDFDNMIRNYREIGYGDRKKQVNRRSANGPRN